MRRPTQEEQRHQEDIGAPRTSSTGSATRGPVASEPQGSARDERGKRLKSRRWKKRLLLFAGLLLAVLAVAPWIAASGAVRDQLLNASLNDSTLELHTEAAEFGWLSPLTLRGVDLRSRQDRLTVEIQKLQFELPWWRLLLKPDGWGHVDVQAPRTAVRLNWREFQGYSAGDIPEFSASIKDADLQVDLQKMKQPVIDVHQVNVDFRIGREGRSQHLVISDTVALDNRQLTTERCSELLQLIDPMLADVADVEGRFSLLIDKLRLPLNVNPDQQRREMQLAGTLKLFDVVTTAKTPLLKGITRVAADIYQRPSSEVVRVVNHSNVQFEVRGGRLFHTGLEFGLPDIDPQLVVRSEGYVGLDEQLDVRVAIPKLFLGEGLKPAKPSDLLRRRKPMETPIARLHITGTIAKPEVIRIDDEKENNANGFTTPDSLSSTALPGEISNHRVEPNRISAVRH